MLKLISNTEEHHRHLRERGRHLLHEADRVEPAIAAMLRAYLDGEAVDALVAVSGGEAAPAPEKAASGRARAGNGAPR